MGQHQSNIDYKTLNKVELELNTIQYRHLELGNLMSFYFDRLYRNDYKKKLYKKLIYIVTTLLKPISKKKILKNYQKEIIYFRSGTHRHLMNLQSALVDCNEINKKTLYISSQNHHGINGNVFLISGILDFFKIVFFLFTNFKLINNKWGLLNFSLRRKIHLLTDLSIQLLKACSLKKFVQLQNTTILIGADYDRGFESSLLFAVAKSLNIRSFSFQHGVINPPIGYTPINADQIWVWGLLAKKQLLELGINPEKIRITGTPIIENIVKSFGTRDVLNKKYKLKPGKIIVLALSSQNKVNDIKLVDFFSKIKEEHPIINDNFLVKIHPARKYEEYIWIKNKYKIDLLPHNIVYQEFINMVDILLAHTSGIATEVLFYNKKVGILDILDDSPGNGIELNKYLEVPLIRQYYSFKKLYNDTILDKGKMIFFKVGEESKMEIQKAINQLTIIKDAFNQTVNF